MELEELLNTGGGEGHSRRRERHVPRQRIMKHIEHKELMEQRRSGRVGTAETGTDQVPSMSGRGPKE